MTNDLANKIAAACLEAIQSRPDTPTEDELAEVVRPLLPDPAEVAQDLKWGVDPAEDPSKSAVWPLANDVEPTKGKWRRYDPTIWGLPTHPSTQKLPWDKLRDPITDGPEYPSTQELYDAHSGRRHTLPSGEFITVDHRGTIRQWDALGNLMTGPNTATPDLCQFAKCSGAVFQDRHGGLQCTCCGRLSTPTTEAPDGE